MQEKIKSEGKCLFCGKTFAKAGISKHLNEELKTQIKNQESGVSFHIRVDPDNRDYGSNEYFLNLWVNGESKMKDIDQFLRDIWLECCGHLSAFYGKGKIAMSHLAKDTLYKGLVVEHEYDFGTPTNLTLKVLEEFPVKAPQKIVLLSRNEPLPILCSSCGKLPAIEMCEVCSYEDDANFCEKCAKKHAETCEDFADYAAMPIVNSPRMGVCGYEGGTIDVERDGNF